jgi:inorganic pyrophosphatase
MIPFAFSAMTMKSVGLAARAMMKEIQNQFEGENGKKIKSRQIAPDYKKCISVATTHSLREMIAPSALILLTPIIVGILFGKECLAGMLPGSFISAVQMAISASNTGGAWDNCKKYIEGGEMAHIKDIEGKPAVKRSQIHKAAVVGDTVGDPLKDTSGPALNIVMKLMAIVSVVFAPVFKQGSPLSGVLMDNGWKKFLPRSERDLL